MKKRIYIAVILLLMLVCSNTTIAQCSICTKTAQQMGEKPAKALNTGIIYLALAPLAIFSFIGYKWWKHNHE